MPPTPEKRVLHAPDVFARALAAVAPDREQRWMLRQPRAVRQSFAAEVVESPDRDVAQEIWMLHQPREVRLSFIEDVLAHDPDTPPELTWMLRQDDAVCRSYAVEVLGAT